MTHKCEHPKCNCQVSGNEKYCSPACGELAGESQLRCDCGHPGCTGADKGK